MAKRKKGSYFRASARKQSSRQGRGFYFVCPNHGQIPREEVIFLCNTCGPQEIIIKRGMHLCPQCFKPGDNFQCFLCNSPEVKMKSRKPSTSAKGK